MKKRILSLLLLAMLLASCAEKQEDEAQVTDAPGMTETQAETEAFPPPEIVDMEGAALTILNYNAQNFNWANTLILTEKLDGETLNDALYRREKAVEENYHCSIEEIIGDPKGTLQKNVTSGDSEFDTAMLFDAEVATVATNDYLLPWNELDVDLTLPWWDTAASEQYNFAGFQAAASGAYSLYNYSTRHCYVFNNDMMKNYWSDVDIYQEVHDGKWTVDRLYELAARASTDLNGDSRITSDSDQYGIASSVTRHYSALLAGANVKYIDRNEDDELYFAIPGSEYATAVIAHLVELNKGNDIFTSGTNDIGGGAESPIFYNGRALFIAAYVGEAAKMRGIEFDIGIVPSPKYSEAQESYYSLVEGGAQSILPKSLPAEKQEKTAILLNAFAYYSYKESIPAYIDEILMTKTVRNQESADMLQLVFDTSFYDLGTGAWSADTKNVYTKNVFLPRSDAIASVGASVEKGMEKKLEKFMENLRKVVE